MIVGAIRRMIPEIRGGKIVFVFIAFALFETTGKSSILPKSAKSPLLAENMQIKKAPASLKNYVVVHGKPQYTVMRETGGGGLVVQRTGN